MMLKTRFKKFFTADFRGLLKDSTWAFAGMVATSGLYFVEVMLLARYFSQELLGVYFLIISFPELVQQVLDVRVKEIMVRYLALFVGQGEKRKAVALIKFLWLLDVGVALLAMVLVMLLSGVVSSALFLDSGYASLMILYAVGMLFEALDSASGPILRVFGRFDLAFLASLLIALVRIGVIALAMGWDTGLSGLIFARVLVFVFSTLFLGYLSLKIAWRELGDHFHTPLNELRSMYRELVGFAFQVNISSTLKTLVSKLDVMIVGLILGEASVAVYKITTQLAKTLLLFSDPLSMAVYPRFSLLFSQNQPKLMNALIKRLTFIMVMGVVPLLVGVFLFRHTLLVAFAGEAYQENTLPFVFATWGIAFALVFFWVRPYGLSLGLAGLLTKSMLISASVSLLGLVFLTWLYGETGAAIGFGLFYALTIMVQLFFISTQSGKRGLSLAIPLDAKS
ncbi:MAG: hypothetical protein Fur0022_44680 [Anaerolineales bacterium]